MKTNNYHNFEKHKLSHDCFIKNFEIVFDDFMRNKTIKKENLEFTFKWFVEHIVGMDAELKL